MYVLCSVDNFCEVDQGMLKPSEIQHLLQRLGFAFTTKQVEFVLSEGVQADVSVSGGITFEQFVPIAQKLKEPAFVEQVFAIRAGAWDEYWSGKHIIDPDSSFSFWWTLCTMVNDANQTHNNSVCSLCVCVCVFSRDLSFTALLLYRPESRSRARQMPLH